MAFNYCTDWSCERLMTGKENVRRLLKARDTLCHILSSASGVCHCEINMINLVNEYFYKAAKLFHECGSQEEHISTKAIFEKPYILWL